MSATGFGRFGLLFACLPATSFAASIGFYLDVTHSRGVGGPFLEVTLSDSTTTPGDIDVSVRTLDALNDFGGSNFGIDKFYLNVAPPVQNNLRPPNIIFKGTASDWRVVQTSKKASDFGRFDLELKGRGGSRTTQLDFTIAGITGDTLLNYASELSSQKKGKRPGFLFAAHVGSLQDGWLPGRRKLHSSYFAGSTPVPIPAALWLLASGLLGLVLLGRRSRGAATPAGERVKVAA